MNRIVVGVDECARGPLLGRIYAAAVILNTSIPIPYFIKDSKKMKPFQRLMAREYIKKHALDYCIVYEDVDHIDKHGVGVSNQSVFNRALQGLKLIPEIAFIDGNNFKPSHTYSYSIETIIKGDDKVPAISAASILAKTEHDLYIMELCKFMPELDKKYDILANMGYGSARHIEGIKKYGLSPFHRRTFCKNFVNNLK